MAWPCNPKCAVVSTAIGLSAVFSPDRLSAEADGPDFFRVVGVAADDVLNIREQPDAADRKIGEIPANSDGVRNLGCVGKMSFAEWQVASDEERTRAAKRRWCKVEFSGVVGWVAARYLTEGRSPELDVRRPDDVAWRIIAIGDDAVLGDPELAFSSGGGLFGATGCNGFTGGVASEEGRLQLGGPLAITQMACPPRMDSQERLIVDILESGPRYSYDPVSDRLRLFAAGLPDLTLQRHADTGKPGAAP